MGVASGINFPRRFAPVYLSHQQPFSGMLATPVPNFSCAQCILPVRFACLFVRSLVSMSATLWPVSAFRTLLRLIMYITGRLGKRAACRWSTINKNGFEARKTLVFL